MSKDSGLFVDRTTIMPPVGIYDPSGQTRDKKIASISNSKNPNHIWTGASWSIPGIMVTTAPITLAHGKYLGIVQIWHKNQTGKLGKIGLFVDSKGAKILSTPSN